MRSRRRTPMAGVQAEKQQQYVRLIAQGVSNSEACRLVGINRKTGTGGATAGRCAIPPGRVCTMPR